MGWACVKRSSEDVARPEEEDWACQLCTLINPPAVGACDACLTPRPEGESHTAFLSDALRGGVPAAAELEGLIALQTHFQIKADVSASLRGISTTKEQFIFLVFFRSHSQHNIPSPASVNPQLFKRKQVSEKLRTLFYRCDFQFRKSLCFLQDSFKCWKCRADLLLHIKLSECSPASH